MEYNTSSKQAYIQTTRIQMASWRKYVYIHIYMHIYAYIYAYIYIYIHASMYNYTCMNMAYYN